MNHTLYKLSTYVCTTSAYIGSCKYKNKVIWRAHSLHNPKECTTLQASNYSSYSSSSKTNCNCHSVTVSYGNTVSEKNTVLGSVVCHLNIVSQETLYLPHACQKTMKMKRSTLSTVKMQQMQQSREHVRKCSMQCTTACQAPGQDLDKLSQHLHPLSRGTISFKAHKCPSRTPLVETQVSV